jgi:phytoene dehydrogenase-like protein
MTQSQTFDVIVIGAGHNGLTVAMYCAKAGLKTAVLERRHEFGGGLSTEEVTLPGFYHNLHSNFHASLPMLPAVHDFNLARRGIHYYHPEANIGMPLRDGRNLILYTDDHKSAAEIRRFSPKDAERYLEFRKHLNELAGAFMYSAYHPPLQTEVHRELLAKELSNRFGEDVFFSSPVDFIRNYFETPQLQALHLYHLAIGGWDARLAGLNVLGMAFYCYLTNWRLCRGGSHQLAHAMGGEFISLGGELIEHAAAKKILVKDGEAVGVECVDGRTFMATGAVISAIDATQTFRSLVDEAELKPKFLKEIDKIQYGPNDVLFGGHLALREAPVYTSETWNPDIRTTFNLNIGYETPEDLIEHYEEVDRKELPKVPRLNASINTLFDRTQAPEPYHTALLWQFAPFDFHDAPADHWDEIKDDYLMRCVDVWSEYAPNMNRGNVLAGYGYTPVDIVRKMVNMRRGGFHFGAVIPGQIADARPTYSLGGYRTPIKKLYMGGSCMHGHGGITGTPGYNCAQVVSADLGVKDKLPFDNKFFDKDVLGVKA